MIEQMLFMKVSQKIYARLEDLCDGDISPSKIEMLSDEKIGSIGTSKPKVSYIRNLTNAIITGDVNLDDLAHKFDAEVMAALTKIRGIGSWTAKCI
ncbi:DNA glycosylase family protein [Selenomonas timonae]|uniref:hypothetical protein n=1 Tax=Selenomonas timonae TaxID=2754044 RepID=UPI001C8F1FC8|nr:hypothetical protein [Selenomonas timonae]